MRKRINISKDVFKHLYIDNGLSLRKIALRLGVSEPIVRNRFKEQGLVLRPRGSWSIKYAKTPFDGSDEEKAYIMGFRIGDLNVYRPSANSNILVVRTNTTCVDQIDLITQMFGAYGGVRVSPGSVIKTVNCFVDKSFDFLLPKPYFPESWITDNLQNSLAFMAGYIDAEGNFAINQGRARFKLDSFDDYLLVWIHDWLTKQSIKSKLRLIAKKGSARYSGGYWNSDLWRLNINEAQSLSLFCQQLAPYLRHKKRVADMKLCLINITKRIINGTVPSK